MHIKNMITRILRRFSTTNNKTYGNLKDQDRIFTNVYKDTDPYISGALRRVTPSLFRATGIRPRTSSSTDTTGSSTKSNSQVSEAGEEQDSLPDLNILSCPRSPLLNDLPTWSSTQTSRNLEPARTGRS